jgi:hypothetical protein
LQSFARFNLRLTDAEFFALTPRQFNHLSRRHKDEREHQEFLFGQLTSWVANTGFRSTKRPTKPRDFMPSMYGPEDKLQKVKLKRRKRKDIAFEARTVMNIFAGIAN